VRIVSVQVAPVTLVGEMRTAFGKRPVAGPVRVGKENLAGDAQEDRRYHGGADMAVLAYAADHYPGWREELGWPGLPLGGFAENLSVAGATEETVCIGDVWRAGTALLQVASPRKPCSKIARFWNRPRLARLVVKSGRTGWHLRVLEEGSLQAGDEIALIERLHPEWTVRRVFRIAMTRKSEREQALEAARVPALADRWKAWLRGEPAQI
jgi:MOSC domain-containing protein YiiM